ncbi:hypothetical protein QBC35DRAFT_97399 [Podospora australis]|uniref:Uncharacterized protein n=1 Tax=Podospora australis TaxID=1536484 RepID=A0AAN6WKI9_9PEZI|nr:hypothetical protein QBC35DRAFT_97399 [Podospora australis]
MLPTIPLLLSLSLGSAPQSSPPSILLTVTNPTSTPYTILTWSSPLDDLAFALGLLPLTSDCTEETIPLNIVQVKRAVPPPPDAYVTIEPGQSVNKTTTIREPTVDLSSLAGQRVRVNWDAKREIIIPVWKGRKEDLLAAGRIATEYTWYEGDGEWLVDGGEGVEVEIPRNVDDASA